MNDHDPLLESLQRRQLKLKFWRSVLLGAIVFAAVVAGPLVILVPDIARIAAPFACSDGDTFQVLSEQRQESDFAKRDYQSVQSKMYCVSPTGERQEIHPLPVFILLFVLLLGPGVVGGILVKRYLDKRAQEFSQI